MAAVGAKGATVAGEAEFDAAWARGSRLSLGEAVDLLAGELEPQ